MLVNNKEIGFELSSVLKWWLVCGPKIGCRSILINDRKTMLNWKINLLINF